LATTFDREDHRRRAANGVAGPLADIDAVWLDGALRADAPAMSRVVEVSAEALTFTGATTDMARLRITYDASGQPGPASVIAKVRGRDDLRRQMDAVMGLFSREARFYGELAASVPIRTPRALALGDGDEHPLVLEDLGHLRLGDQSQGLSAADAEATLDALADLHAKYWDSAAIAASWLNRPTQPTFKQILVQFVESGAPTLAQRYDGEVPDDVLGRVIAAAPRWDDVLEILSQGPKTLVHNDCRLDNLFFEPEGTPVFVDWQLVASTRGSQDVGNLLAGSVEAADLSGSWERLLRRYHDRLVARGVRGYSFDECVLHYRQNIVWALGQGMALLGSLSAGDERGVGDRIVRRALPHIAELESFEALGMQ
jgi:Ecdysteroid kinase-like family